VRSIKDQLKKVRNKLDIKSVPECPYCGKDAELVDSKKIYPQAIEDYGMFWLCRPCQAWTGCHKNSKRHAPKGRLANAELRHWKQEAQKAFDPMWKSGEFTRTDAYNWLRAAMGKSKQVHIGFMDVRECKQVVEICNVKSD